MPTLLLLNGPPGIGKSTVARRWVAQRPLAYCLDIDGIRRLIGRWDEHPHESGLLARAIAIAAARVALSEGRDVVLPQYLADLGFISELEALAADVGARFVEVLLMDSKENAAVRFWARRDDPAAAEHQRECESQIGGPEVLGRMWDRLQEVMVQRPHTKVVPCTCGDIDGTVAALLAVLDG